MCFCLMFIGCKRSELVLHHWLRCLQVAVTIYWLGKYAQQHFTGPQLDVSAFVDLVDHDQYKSVLSASRSEESDSAASEAPPPPPARSPPPGSGAHPEWTSPRQHSGTSSPGHEEISTPLRGEADPISHRSADSASSHSFIRSPSVGEGDPSSYRSPNSQSSHSPQSPRSADFLSNSPREAKSSHSQQECPVETSGVQTPQGSIHSEASPHPSSDARVQQSPDYSVSLHHNQDSLANVQQNQKQHSVIERSDAQYAENNLSVSGPRDESSSPSDARLDSLPNKDSISHQRQPSVESAGYSSAHGSFYSSDSKAPSHSESAPGERPPHARDGSFDSLLSPFEDKQHSPGTNGGHECSTQQLKMQQQQQQQQASLRYSATFDAVYDQDNRMDDTGRGGLGRGKLQGSVKQLYQRKTKIEKDSKTSRNFSKYPGFFC